MAIATETNQTPTDTGTYVAPQISIPELSESDTQRRDEMVGRLFGSFLGAFELLNIYIGSRLDLYRALRESGPVTPRQLAERTGTNERYIREWLEQQAVSGMLDVQDVKADASSRVYSLPPGHAEVLLEPDSLNHMMPMAHALVGLTRPIDSVIEAFRSGGGVSWADYGDEGREGQAAINRPMFRNLLGSQWLPAVPDVHARLQADPPARVADIACGGGWSSIAIAQAYPKVRVVGMDSDEGSIVLAEKNAAENNVQDRVTFKVHDATATPDSGPYDLVTIFEALHDMSRPVEALRAVRNNLAPGGAFIIADEKTEDTFTAPGSELERFFYAFSTVLCLPNGMAEQPSAGTGTVMRQDTVRRYATEAGFSSVEILPIENDFFRFYRLIP